MRNDSMHARAVYMHCVLYHILFVPSLQGQLFHRPTIYSYMYIQDYNGRCDIVIADDACTQYCDGR